MKAVENAAVAGHQAQSSCGERAGQGASGEVEILLDGACVSFVRAGHLDGQGAGVRRHGELTLTIVADGVAAGSFEIEPLADPPARLLVPAG